jgi:hypothetical protein
MGRIMRKSEIKISAGLVVTEPKRLGYLTFSKCAKSLLSFCDEVLVIFGRDEPESRKLIQHIGARTHVTNEWPEKYNYDHMRDHFQLIFDLCQGDIVFKVDADRVFRTEMADKIRKSILNRANCHRIDFVGLKFIKKPDLFMYNRKNTVTYGINKTLLKKDKIKFHISNEAGSNQPLFSSEEITKERIFDVPLQPVNYDCTFMTKSQVAYKWFTLNKARARKKGKKFNFRRDDEDSIISHFELYHSLKNRNRRLKKDTHPKIMQGMIDIMTKDMWGYNNWK